jgi:hypothetical protein
MKLSNSEMVVNAQAYQVVVRDKLYAAESQQEKEMWTDEYNQSVKTLIQLLGNNVHCNNVDCDLWGYFSDYYKDVNGVRPHHYMTREDVESWIVQDHELLED